MTMYFGEKGITSTSANYLANLAKECIKEAEVKLNNISFLNKSVELINENKKTLRIGTTEIENIETLLTDIANMHSFCAWVREALKARDEALKKIEALTLAQFANITGIELPNPPKGVQKICDEDILNEMNTKERNNYLRLEAFAATFGKYIHPDGYISLAREELLYRKEVPNEVDGNGRDMVIYSYLPSISTETIEELFLKLQNNYREYERQLNAIKFKIKEDVNMRNIRNLKKYEEENNNYFQIVEKITSDKSLYITQKREEIANMKIVIPEKLQGIYEYLNSLGKVSKT